MPTPRTPPQIEVLENLQAEVAAQSALIQTQTVAIQQLQNDLNRVSNFQRLMYESSFGADANSVGIWDNTDRY